MKKLNKKDLVLGDLAYKNDYNDIVLGVVEHSMDTVSDNLVTGSDIGATDGTWVDQGTEIDCRGFSKLGVYIDFTVSDSTTNKIQMLSKHSPAGTEYTKETASDYQKTIGDSDIKIFYLFDVTTIPWIQIQSQAGDVDTGGGTIGTLTIDIVKGNN